MGVYRVGVSHELCVGIECVLLMWVYAMFVSLSHSVLFPRTLCSSHELCVVTECVLLL